ncbi:Mth938-like domain-containing protein [Pelistega ratti]|uniref:Mth938-like domain-containing protein n=1 Tax=Pelistega ratti TaxID=2652177 RepID=UPI0013570645|nr:Mth938-like domain-containing protein [Pelistega ratti]
MQLHREQRTHLNTVTGYGDNYIEVNDQRYHHPIFFSPEGDITPWEIEHFTDITLEHLEKAAGLTVANSSVFDFLEDNPTRQYANAPEVIIIGTGKKQAFIPPHILAPLLHARIGIEMMDSKAAARTYNVLMAEGRRVIVALLID